MLPTSIYMPGTRSPAGLFDMIEQNDLRFQPVELAMLRIDCPVI